MAKRDPILTPELIKILKIFIFASLALVVFFSFFDGHRANNSGEDRTFRVTDSNRIYFQNVRSIHYAREIRQDASMTLYRHRTLIQSDSLPNLHPMIILNPLKDDAYIYFELVNGDWPIQIRIVSSEGVESIDFDMGNNQDYFTLFKKLAFAVGRDAQFELVLGKENFPLWKEDRERDAVESIVEDYFKLIDYAN
jgi:hypothetical protein